MRSVAFVPVPFMLQFLKALTLKTCAGTYSKYRGQVHKSRSLGRSHRWKSAVYAVTKYKTVAAIVHSWCLLAFVRNVWWPKISIKVGQIAEKVTDQIGTILHIVLKSQFDHACFREEEQVQILVVKCTKRLISSTLQMYWPTGCKQVGVIGVSAEV